MIDINGLNPKDRGRIEEIGLSRWMDEVIAKQSKSEQPSPSVVRGCAICGKQFNAERSDARYCSGKCARRASRHGRTVRIKAIKLSENKGVKNAIFASQ